jgi:hypothetical protein
VSCLQIGKGLSLSAIVRTSTSRGDDRIGSICRNRPPLAGLKAIRKIDDGKGRDRRSEAIEKVPLTWENRYLSMSNWPSSIPFRSFTSGEEGFERCLMLSAGQGHFLESNL